MTVDVTDASNFVKVLKVCGTEIEGDGILRAESPEIPSAIVPGSSRP